MTTKKQRRLQTGEKREQRIAEDKRVGLEALARAQANRAREKSHSDDFIKNKRAGIKGYRPVVSVMDEVDGITVGDFLTKAHKYQTQVEQECLQAILSDEFKGL